MDFVDDSGIGKIVIVAKWKSIVKAFIVGIPLMVLVGVFSEEKSVDGYEQNSCGEKVNTWPHITLESIYTINKIHEQGLTASRNYPVNVWLAPECFALLNF